MTPCACPRGLEHHAVGNRSCRGGLQSALVVALALVAAGLLVAPAGAVSHAPPPIRTVRRSRRARPGAAAPGTATPTSAPAAGAARPNIVVLMTDDQTVESMRVLPKVRALLEKHGVTFSSYFASYPLCCPSRTTYFTGQYAHNHHVLYNMGSTGGYHVFRGQNTTFPVALQRVGYHTIHIGKYLNGYGKHVRPAHAPIPPGWNDWNGSIDPSTYRYYDFILDENGHPHSFDMHQYQTDVYANMAVRKIHQEAARPGPFLLDVAFLAPHAVERETSGLDPVDQQAAGGEATRHGIRYAVPVRKYLHRFAHARLPHMRGAFDERNVSDKPANIQARHRFDREEVGEIRTDYRRRLATLLSVDDAVRKIVGALRTTGQLADTDVIFVSDNGYFHGQHRVPFGKYLPYEPSIHVPLVVRGPGFAEDAVSSSLASNVDLAPTILQLAGAKPLRTLDGHSLLPELRDPTHAVDHDAILIESGKNDVGAPVYAGLRTRRYKYVEYRDGERELYDLRRDPGELHNRYGDSKLATVQRYLAARLISARSCVGAACP